jgi:predicted nucleic acid-binding protein
LLILDANVAVKFIIDEPGRTEALKRLQSELVLVAPDWLKIEVAHAVWKHTRIGELNVETARQSSASIDEFFDHFVPAAELLPAALRLAFELQHWVYDCLYLACALRTDAPLLTADRKFWNAAKRGGYGEAVELLTWKGQAG